MNAPFPIPEIAPAPTRAKAAKVWARVEDDWYVEDVAVTAALLGRERFVGPVWDPACGRGNVLRALAAAGYACAGTDLKRRISADLASRFAGTFDFLAGDMPGWSPFPFGGALNVACNPPFYRAVGAEGFARRALGLSTGKVALHVALRFVTGVGRARGLFAEHPPARIYMIAPRRSCVPGPLLEAFEAGTLDKRAVFGGDGGEQDFVWIVWDRTAPAGDTRWLWLTIEDGKDRAAGPEVESEHDNDGDDRDARLASQHRVHRRDRRKRHGDDGEAGAEQRAGGSSARHASDPDNGAADFRDDVKAQMPSVVAI